MNSSHSILQSEHAIVESLGSGLTDIGDPVVLAFRGERQVAKCMMLEVHNTGTAFNDFALLVKPHADAAYHTYLSSTGWDTAAGVLKKVVGSPKNLANAAKAFAYVDMEGVYAFKFQASISGGTRAKGILTATQNATNAKATGVFTATGQPADTQTVAIGGETYIFDTVLVDSPNHVLIGATAEDTLNNLIAALTAGAGEGTLYGTGTTEHPTVTAAAGAGDTMDVTAKARGTAGNSIATTDTADNMSWGAATLTGGTLETVTLDGETYTFKHSDNMVDDNDVEIGATKEDTIDNLVVVATATQTRCTVARASATMVATANNDISSAAATTIETTETAAQWAWGAATFADAVTMDAAIKCSTVLEG